MWHNPYVRTGQFRRGRLWARVAVWRLREGWARLPIGVRFLWLLLGVMLGLMTPLLGVGYLFLQHSLEMHQQLVQRQRLEAVVRALERELAALLRQVQDYTVWNDAHTAISRRDAPWIQRNITEWLPQQFHYDFAVVVDAQGAVVGQAGREWAWLRQTELFQRARRGVSSAGLHRRGETIYLIAAAPYRRRAVVVAPQQARWWSAGRWTRRCSGASASRQGTWARCSLRQLWLSRTPTANSHSAKCLGNLCRRIPTPSCRFPLQAGGTKQCAARFPSRSGARPRGSPRGAGWRAKRPTAVPLAKRGEPQGGGQFMHSDHAIGIASSLSHLLHDSTGQPIAWLTVEPPRAEQAWLLDALCLAKQYLLVFGGALALIASLTMVLLLQSHLRRFSVAIQRLASGDWDARVAYPARDEFGYLARAFNQMAQQLQQAFEAQEQQREELLAQNEELERMHAQLQQAHQELATLNAELLEANRALAQAAVTDGLTGLKNHRAFQEALHSAAQMAERLQQPLSLVMFDIDHFKQFNDTFGHPAGDELLRQVAQVLRESARAYDVAARYGGEEFALLLPNTTLEQAVQVAERLRQQIRAIENPHAPVSASFGVATYRRGTPPATLVYEADAALYRAKRSGRDQVCVYQPEAA
jgi:diguanylate cyclase (GGDEF)-like protein